MAKKESFEVALHSLEKAVAQLESGELSLEDSLRSFEEGVKSAALCQKLLQAVETKVELLLKDKNGKLTQENFDAN